MTNHTLSDFCTRLRNAYLAKKETLSLPKSKITLSALNILREDGYILSFSTKKLSDKSTHDQININLKYTSGIPALSAIGIISKPGKRVYCKYSDIPEINNGLGSIIISTSRGLKTSSDAIKQKLGGELLFKVF
jgi:small subunit ribosomal protein S8